MRTSYLSTQILFFLIIIILIKISVRTKNEPAPVGCLSNATLGY